MTGISQPKTDLPERQHVIQPRNLALGIERMGFAALSHPALVAVTFLALCVLAAFGFLRLKVDDSLSQLFRSNTEEYRTYQEVTQRFPSSEFDVLIVIEGNKRFWN